MHIFRWNFYKCLRNQLPPEFFQAAGEWDAAPWHLALVNVMVYLLQVDVEFLALFCNKWTECFKIKCILIILVQHVLVFQPLHVLLVVTVPVFFVVILVFLFQKMLYFFPKLFEFVRVQNFVSVVIKKHVDVLVQLPLFDGVLILHLLTLWQSHWRLAFEYLGLHDSHALAI